MFIILSSFFLLQIRIWGLALTDTEILEHIQLAGLDRQTHKYLLDAHFNMDNEEFSKYCLHRFDAEYAYELLGVLTCPMSSLIGCILYF